MGFVSEMLDAEEKYGGSSCNHDALIKQAEQKGYERGVRGAIEVVPEKDDGINEHTGMPNYKDFNKGVVAGWNDCRMVVENELKALLNNK